MFYSVETTMPTLNIKTVEDYKERVREILKGQLRELIQPYRFLNVFFWIFCLIAIPCSIIYAALSIVELVFDTIFLPVSLLPVVRKIPFVVSVLIWSLTFAIGLFSCVNLAYDIDEPLVAPWKKKKDIK